jgi:hypothetical protein
MKHLLFVALAATLLTSCYNAERNCTDFKTGTFRSEIEIDGQKKVTEFTRNEAYEIGTYDGKVDTASVRWINDCEYVLQTVNPKNAAEMKGVHMKILTTKQNSYTFEFSLIGDSHKQKGTVTKLD